MIEQEFAGQVVLVTGAASGIGAAVVRALRAQGAQVAACDVDRARLAELARAHAARPYAFDVTCLDQVEQAVRAIEQEQGPIDGLVNAAGVLVAGKLSSGELMPAAFRRCLAVNVEGVWNVTRTVAQGMRARGRGAVVTVSSNAGKTPRMNMGAYCASKAAASMLTQCMGLELAARGVRCNVVSPGSTDTPMLRDMLGPRGPGALIEGDLASFRLGIPLGRIASAEDITQGVLFLLSSRSRHITMHDLRVDGGATW